MTYYQKLENMAGEFRAAAMKHIRSGEDADAQKAINAARAITTYSFNISDAEASREVGE